jgi:hypothetical protein
MRRLPPAGVLLPLVLAIALMPVVEHLAFASNDDPAARASATCSDYSNQRDAQLKRDTRDADGDGIYCESLPCPCLEPGRAGGGGGGSRKGDDPRGCRLVRRPVRVRFDDDRWLTLPTTSETPSAFATSEAGSDFGGCSTSTGPVRTRTEGKACKGFLRARASTGTSTRPPSPAKAARALMSATSAQVRTEALVPLWATSSRASVPSSDFRCWPCAEGG